MIWAPSIGSDGFTDASDLLFVLLHYLCSRCGVPDRRYVLDIYWPSFISVEWSWESISYLIVDMARVGQWMEKLLKFATLGIFKRNPVDRCVTYTKQATSSL